MSRTTVSARLDFSCKGENHELGHVLDLDSQPELKAALLTAYRAGKANP